MPGSNSMQASVPPHLLMHAHDYAATRSDGISATLASSLEALTGRFYSRISSSLYAARLSAGSSQRSCRLQASPRRATRQ